MTAPVPVAPEHVLLTAYGAVLAAELLGDRTLFAASALATRYRPASVFAGLSAGFAVKMAAAVLLGQLIGGLPARVRVATSIASFVVAAVIVWRERGGLPDEQASGTSWRADARAGVRAALLACGMVLSVEWVDAGQIAAVAVTASTRAPLLVWAGGVLALLTKGLIAVTLGAGLARRLSWRTRRAVSFGALLALGALTLIVGGE